MTIAIGGDHAGYQFKEKIKAYLISLDHETLDFGPKNEESCDYPDIAHPIAKSITDKKAAIGIAICGSGNGISMTLNKHENIRAALCWNKEIVELARLHNDANILALPARFIDINDALEFVDVFLSTKFEGGRHQRRVNKINK